MKVYIIETEENDNWKMSLQLFPLVLAMENKPIVPYDQVERNEHGKPLPINGFHFNISHAGKYWVMACASTECGINIEERRHIDTRLSSRILAPSEMDQIDNLLDEWVVKEAYSKMTGQGGELDMSSITTDWLLENYIVTDLSDDDYICYAVGTEAMGEIIKLRWDGQELQSD